VRSAYIKISKIYETREVVTLVIIKLTTLIENLSLIPIIIQHVCMTDLPCLIFPLFTYFAVAKHITGEPLRTASQVRMVPSTLNCAQTLNY